MPLTPFHPGKDSVEHETWFFFLTTAAWASAYFLSAKIVYDSFKRRTLEELQLEWASKRGHFLGKLSVFWMVVLSVFFQILGCGAAIATMVRWYEYTDGGKHDVAGWNTSMAGFVAIPFFIAVYAAGVGAGLKWWSAGLWGVCIIVSLLTAYIPLFWEAHDVVVAIVLLSIYGLYVLFCLGYSYYCLWAADEIREEDSGKALGTVSDLELLVYEDRVSAQGFADLVHYVLNNYPASAIEGGKPAPPISTGCHDGRPRYNSGRPVPGSRHTTSAHW